MRLTETEVDAIKSCAADVFGSAATVRLFGSRADDTRRGGDIDLYVEVPDPDRATLQAEIDSVVRLKKRIGEQRVDVVLRGPGDARSAIDAIALADGDVL